MLLLNYAWFRLHVIVNLSIHIILFSTSHYDVVLGTQHPDHALKKFWSTISSFSGESSYGEVKRHSSILVFIFSFWFC